MNIMTIFKAGKTINLYYGVLMKLFRLLFLFGILGISIYSQSTGLNENFDNNDLSRWKSDHVRSFQLAPDNGTMKITYTRSAQSDPWDNFNYTPVSTIDIRNNPYITIRVKSNINTVLSIKPTAGENPPLIDKTIVGDNEWHTISFKANADGSKTFNKIYMYFDGGTTNIKNGTIYFDDMKAGDQVTVDQILEWTNYDRAIASAQALILNIKEGTAEGEAPTGSKSSLQDVVNKYKNLKSESVQSQNIIEQAVWDLYDSCVNLETKVKAVSTNLIDIKATKETRYLYLNLLNMSGKSLMFGMHDATGYGVGWSGDDNRSDVKDVCGDMPAVFSEDMNNIELDNEPERLRYRLKTAYQKGSVITLCWHQYDHTGTHFYVDKLTDKYVVSKYIPGGTKHEDYKTKLKKVATFLKSFRGEKGESIPVIFRPYHEHYNPRNSSPFWWCSDYCTPDEYNQLWRFTVEYLRDSLNVHNIIWAISPILTYVDNGDEYFNTYPGDNYVDIFGTDYYYPKSTASVTDINTLKNGLSLLANHASKRNKIPALTEVGHEALPIADWFTKYLLEPIKSDPSASKMVYAAVWRNASTTHHFAPYPGHKTTSDFVQFYNDAYTLFQNDLLGMYQLPAEDKTPPAYVSIHDKTLISSTKKVKIIVETNERAFLRYSFSNQSYDNMINHFTVGEGSFKHEVEVEGEQDIIKTLYIQAVDNYGNKTSEPLMINFKVDSLETIVTWKDTRYDNSKWGKGKTPLGVDASALTKINKVKTVYFKSSFTINEMPSAIAVTVKAFGGMALYINNVEISREALPSDILNYDTKPVSLNTITKTIMINSDMASKFKTGKNEIAIEVHSDAVNGVPQFDVQIINQKYEKLMAFGSDWTFYDSGSAPADIKLRDLVDTEEETNIPSRIALLNNYPNPFNPATKIPYELNEETFVLLEVYDIIGRNVKTLVSEVQKAGSYTVVFDAGNLASGVYIVRLKTENKSFAKKILLVK